MCAGSWPHHEVAGFKTETVLLHEYKQKSKKAKKRRGTHRLALSLLRGSPPEIRGSAGRLQHLSPSSAICLKDIFQVALGGMTSSACQSVKTSLISLRLLPVYRGSYPRMEAWMKCSPCPRRGEFILRRVRHCRSCKIFIEILSRKTIIFVHPCRENTPFASPHNIGDAVDANAIQGHCRKNVGGTRSRARLPLEWRALRRGGFCRRRETQDPYHVPLDQA